MRSLVCRFAALSLALLASAVAVAADSATGSTTIYRWVDAQGVVHYSDAPQAGAQQLHIAPAQTYAAPPGQAGPGFAAAIGGPALPPAYQVCSIAQPTPEQAFYAPELVAVSLQLVPGLRPGDRITVTVDGKAVGPANDTGLDFQLDSPDRGAHTLSAVVHDAGGGTVCTAPPVTFYIQRPSQLSPQSPSRPPGAVPPGPRH